MLEDPVVVTLATILDTVAPDVVVNCMAMSSPGRCEREPERAILINYVRPPHAKQCLECMIVLLLAGSLNPGAV